MLPNKHISTRQPLLLFVLVWMSKAFFFAYRDEKHAKERLPTPFAKRTGGGVSKSSTARSPIAVSIFTAILLRRGVPGRSLASTCGRIDSVGVLIPNSQRGVRLISLSAAICRIRRSDQ